MAAGSASAQAAPVYQAQVQGSTVDQNGVSTPFNIGFQSPGPAPVENSKASLVYSVSASAQPTNKGTVTSQVIMSSPTQVAASGGGHAQTLIADSTVLYQIELSGTGTDPTVNVHIGAVGGIQWNQDGNAEVLFRLRNYNTGASLIDDDVRKTSNPNSNFIHGEDGFKVDQTFAFVPGEIYSVELYAHAFGDFNGFNGTGDNGGMQVTASVDPTFTVVGDAASRWTVVGFPIDDSTPPGVPEPATWAMMIAGFGLAGASLRRRRALPVA